MFASGMLLMQRYMAVSSEKSLTLNHTCSGRSFMYARNKMGPRTEPCGTPEKTGIVPEWKPFVTTDCFQVYTYSIPGVFAQGAKHPLLDYLSFFYNDHLLDFLRIYANH